MSTTDADAVREALGAGVLESLTSFEAFAAIGSTNTYLMEQDGPAPGKLSVALTTNQTAGRGRHGKSWQSPPDSGLALSAAFTFASQPSDLPALTLVIGLAAIEALEELGVGGIQLKWPNDLLARDAKLGGILTESQSRDSGAVTIVTGIGINLDLGPEFVLANGDQAVRPVTDISSLVPVRPATEAIAAALVNHFHDAFVRFDATGFTDFAPRWADRDWLLGREVVVETGQARVAGVAAGIDDEGALLLEAGGTVKRVTSGTVLTQEEASP